MTLARHTPHLDEAALVLRHRGLAHTIAVEFYIVGADRDDVKQEAMIGLLVAIRTYDGRGGFSGFASMVIRRWLQTEMTRAHREKRRPLNDAIRVMRDPETKREWPAVDLLEDRSADIVDRLTRREDFARFVAAARALTALERDSLMGLANGLTYAEISEARGGESFKAIDNATQRARRKLRDAA